jgi:hypothetical protein
MPEREQAKVAAAISAAIHLYLQEETKAPPFIILPNELQSTSSPWRFVGRKENMDVRYFVQLKMLRQK